MMIRVGILGSDPSWRLLLRQEGVPHSPVSGGASHTDFSAMVVSGGAGAPELDILRSFLSRGGSVLCPGSVFARISGTQAKRRFTRYVLGDRAPHLFPPDLTDLFAECDIPSQANSLETDSGVPSAYAGEFGGGHLVVLPFDPSALALDRRVASKSFYAGRKRLPFERVSLVSKGGLLKIVSRALTILHHRRGLPYVHQWYYPSNLQSLFSLRIDTDYANRAELEELRDLARRSNVPLTWFVDVGSQKDLLPLFREMAGGKDEVGIHCYHHRAFPDPEAHAGDVRSALREFESAGLTARSYAAPYGQWDESHGETIEQFRFVYSSEFSYDYDNIPSYPYLRGGFSSTLQVPVHPVSIGSLRRQGFGEKEMTAYFRAVIERKIQAREPVFLYHHPKNGHAAVLEAMLGYVRERGLQPVRLIDYASWWKLRECEGWRISVEGSTLGVEIPAGSVHQGLAPEEVISGPSPFGAANPLIHIIRQDGMEAFTGPDRSLKFGDLKWESTAAWPPLPADIGRIRKFNPWIPIIRTQDKLTKLFKA